RLRALGNVEGDAAAPRLARRDLLQEVDLRRLALTALRESRLRLCARGRAEANVALRGAVVNTVPRVPDGQVHARRRIPGAEQPPGSTQGEDPSAYGDEQGGVRRVHPDRVAETGPTRL